MIMSNFNITQHDIEGGHDITVIVVTFTNINANKMMLLEIERDCSVG